MTNEEIKKIIENHKHWVYEDVNGWTEMCACFENANLSGAYFRDANLLAANFCGADLTDANFMDANLRGAYLMDADLRGANLIGADLHNADLKGAILRGAVLRGANLWGADLAGADLTGVEDINISLACPSEGSFVAWKKCLENRLVKLFVFKDSKRSSATTNKCRTDKAKVLSIMDIDTGEYLKDARSCFDSSFIYRVGEIVKVNDFDENRFNECAPGIHFFIDKEAAIDY